MARTPGELVAHQALMQGTEAWQFIDGDKIITVRPQGRFMADNGTALVAAPRVSVFAGYNDSSHCGSGQAPS